jgi:deoxyadenosine/deoxycytidine kinase
MAKLVTIEGNIGSGKTTIARMVANYMPDSRFFPAPENSANPHWPAYLAAPKQHALAMQTWFLLARLHVYNAAIAHMEHKRERCAAPFYLAHDRAAQRRSRL